MDSVEQDVWVSLREAQAMEHTGSRTELLAGLVRRADAGDVPRATYLSRRLLADAHRVDGRWDEVFRLFRECLDEYDHRPWRFDDEDEVSLLSWHAWLVGCMVDFPDLSLVEITAALDDVERRFLAAGLGLHEVHAARRGVAAHLGDWPTADRAFRRWADTADPAGDDRWRRLVEVEQLLARGEEASTARAHELARPVLADPSTVDRAAVSARSLMLLPVARTGAWADAVVLYRRLLRGMSGEFHSLEEHGRIVEFCALTGNEDAGVDWLGPMRGFQARRRPLATMEFAASVAVLARRMVELGRGDAELDLGEDPNSGPFRVLADRMRRLALDLADRFDRRNGTSAQGDRIRARLAARPLVEHLPLAPTTRRPLPTLPPPLPASALLDRAEWHDLRCEPDEARACLAVLPAGLPEDLAAREAELRAKFFQSGRTEPELWWAADVHRRNGDLRRALLVHCWLGLWIVAEGRPAQGAALTADAVAGLRRLGDETACAWGEHWAAYVAAALGRPAEAEQAVRRGLRHATGDPLARGSLLLLDASLFPDRTVGSATAALTAFVEAEAPEKALEALAHLENADAHHGLVDPLLARLAGRRDRLVGRLRYLRACALIDAGRLAEAADDLNEAIGQASLRAGGATVEQWYRLAQADDAAGRHEDAVDAGLRAAAWLDHLRDTEDAGWAEWADHARYLVAENFHRLGDRAAALREYRRVADGGGPLAASAFVAGSVLLDAG
ncbi:hypothetical protein ABZ816_33895 [Actinosynnema sp. NPDC047251]|uniref:Tetratricopeptide repeat protein n=1 Tax=Saccharothrix espanaensis (strain ATCC 51144 / DSM 44229 / JCM 9112 / NBRC 15066 / NRRL 15764) TaxID=1179773 RepID=K0JYV8_SACES|nr:hypothetical protein [Saccharothrix espanaensis]CCH33110.1 hypothetical protein BN6_58520 [Saccharothrix espanaensis DSM 44229]